MIGWRRCSGPPANDGCGGLSVAGKQLEDHVAEAVFAHLGQDTVSRLVANPVAFTRELADRYAAAPLLRPGRVEIRWR